jgi:hypothetical protein
MKLNQELNRTKNRVGLVSGALKINEYDDAKQNVSACINPINWNIEINLRRDFNPVKDRRQRAYARAKKIEDGKAKLLEDVLLHELAHWELPFSSGLGCPYDNYYHDLILESVKDSLPEDRKGQAGYIANAFEDLMINPRCKEFNGDFSGQVLFWDDQGFECRKKGQESYTPFYEAFVKLNMHLFGDNKDRALLKRHYSNNSKVDKAVKKTIDDLNLPENIEDTSILFNKDNWQRMAGAFAKNMVDLLDVSPTEKLSAYSGNEDSSQGSSQGEDSQSGNGIEEKVKTKEGKEQIAYGRYGSNKGLSPNINSYEQLDSLYRRLARAIPVHVEAMTKENGIVINPINYRPFDEDTDDIRKLKPTKLFVDEEGIRLGHPRDYLTVVEKSKVQRKSFPNFKMVILDNSGSMNNGIDGNLGNKTYIPWGDNSKYHYALLGFYGIENFLQSQGIAQYIGHGMSLFSSSTRYKESDFVNIEELRKLALSPEFGGTTLDAGSLIDALNGRESFVLSISDGEIGNWNQSKSRFFELAEQNYFAHVQIGSKNSFTNDLESKGLPVFYVNSGDELSRLMVNTAMNIYKRFTKQ